jgi:CspA family cold shock protein
MVQLRVSHFVQRKDTTMSNEQKTGTVKFFNAAKGFGFIVQDAGGPDVFVHISQVERSGMNPADLREGTKVAFDIERSPKSGRDSAANLKAASAE